MKAFFEHPYARIYYETIGHGVPVADLHGYELDLTTMKHWFEPLYKNYAGLQRIYIDLPGMGKSMASSKLKSAEHMLIALNSCLEHILKRKSYHLVGLSYGGYLSLHLAAQNQAKVLSALLIVPAIHACFLDRAIPPFRIAVQDTDFLATLSPQQYDSIKDWMVVQTEYTYRRTINEIYPSLARGQKSFLKRFADKGYVFADEAVFLSTPLDTPLTIIAGKEDNVVGYDDAVVYAGQCPNADVIVIANAGHNLPIEQPDKFNAQVYDWIESAHLSFKT